jgi:ABC-type nitrate/sulfonate/bicarbonate transport system substrate-binding protein
MFMPRAASFVAFALAIVLAAGAAQAADTVRVGKPSAIDFYFSIQDVGLAAGIFQKYNLDIETVALDGSGKLHQALTADSIDVGMGAGTDLSFVAKGAPEKAVANMAGPPVNMYVLVSEKSGIKSIADLKGKRMGVSTMGSLTYWLATELSRRQGWGDTGFQIVTAGNVQAEAAAFVSGELDAAVASLEAGLVMQEKGQAHPFMSFGELVPTFIVHAFYATDTMMAQHPDVLRRYLKAWFETVAYAKSHRDETIKASQPITRLSDAAAAKDYDIITPTLADDGHFDPKAIDVMLKSLTDMGQIDTKPNPTDLYTEAFLK